MGLEVGYFCLLQHHMGCEWRHEFAMSMPEAACLALCGALIPSRLGRLSRRWRPRSCHRAASRAKLPAALRCHLRRALGRIWPSGRIPIARRRPAAAEPPGPAHHPLRARARRQETATLASAGCTKSPELVLGAAESARHAGEDARENGADQRGLLVVHIVSRQSVREATFRAKRTLRLLNSLVFHSDSSSLSFARK